MLQIKDVSKEYITGELHQSALDHVSLNLRNNEFVAILGPSGSGKTTLLNIIGGLDRYDSGDLIINGISTKKYPEGRVRTAGMRRRIMSWTGSIPTEARWRWRPV